MVELNGELSNQDNPAKLAHAAAVRVQLTAKKSPTSVPPRSLPSRSASLRSHLAVTARDRPLQAREIPGAVELLLGESVSWSSVTGTLAANARGANASFQRVCRWRYRVA